MRSHESGNRAIVRGLAAGATALLLAAWAGDAAADKYAGEFMELGLGARSLGMGSSFSALADDATSGYWNPAGLAEAPRRDLMLTHSEQFGGEETYDAGAYVHPLGGEPGHRAAWGVTYQRLAIPDIPVTTGLAYDDLNHDGQFTPGVDSVKVDPSLIYNKTFAYNTFLLSYGREHNRSTSFGVNAKVIYDTFDNSNAMGIGVDLAARHQTGPWTLAAVLKDATSTLIVWSTERKETVSPSLRLGAAWKRDVASLHGSLTLAGEMVNYFENRSGDAATWSAGRWSADLRAGAEYGFAHVLAIRGGVNAGVFSAGAGLTLGRFGLDYAFLEDNGLDSTHRVSASVGF